MRIPFQGALYRVCIRPSRLGRHCRAQRIIWLFAVTCIQRPANRRDVDDVFVDVPLISDPLFINVRQDSSAETSTMTSCSR